MENFYFVDNFLVKHFVYSKNIHSFEFSFIDKQNTSTTNEFFNILNLYNNSGKTDVHL